MAARVRAGDAVAFELLFNAYWAALVRSIQGLVSSRAAAEDVVQEVLLKIWRTRETWQPGANLTAYLFAMTRNAALNARRRRALEMKWNVALENADGEASDIADTGPLPDAIAEDNVRTDALVRAAARLSPRMRETFLLRWRDGLSYAEIAAALGVPLKTVDRRLGRTFAVLRRLLRSWGSDDL